MSLLSVLAAQGRIQLLAGASIPSGVVRLGFGFGLPANTSRADALTRLSESINALLHEVCPPAVPLPAKLDAKWLTDLAKTVDVALVQLGKSITVTTNKVTVISDAGLDPMYCTCLDSSKITVYIDAPTVDLTQITPRDATSWSGVLTTTSRAAHVKYLL